ncbi:glycosyltransferase [Pediococcus inopinatus]|uniref:glycosyltransferase n=1 Tax=Pediococcus inopinatus TaxID=114090 RepID=UPI0007C547D4|nr:glycosyltransferase [Pediococcus inopinatus]
MSQVQVLEVQISDIVGGIENFLENLCGSDFSSNDISYTIVGNNAPTEVVQRLSEAHCTYIEMPTVNSLKKYFLFWKKVYRSNEFDIIHFHKNSNANIIPIVMAKILTTSSIIIQSHNSAPSIQNRLLIFLNYFNRPIVNKLADTRIAVSKQAAYWLFGKRLTEKGSIQIINNGVNTKSFEFDRKKRTIIREKLNIDKNFVLGHVGRFTEQKNHRFLINLFEQIHNKYPETKLVLIGTGPLFQNIKRMVSEKKLNNSVIFLGEVENVNEYLMAMDCFIFPSIFEGLPIALLEAEASGLPAMISNRISEEVLVTSRCYAIGLRDLDNWMAVFKEVLSKNERYFESRSDFSAVIDHEGFGVVKCVNKINQIYMRLGKNGKKKYD